MNFKNFMKGPIEEVFKIGDEEHKLKGYSRANIQAQKEKLRKEYEQDTLNRRLSKFNGKTKDWNTARLLDNWCNNMVTVPIIPDTNPKNTPSEWLNSPDAKMYFVVYLPSPTKYASLDMDGQLYLSADPLRRNGSWRTLFDNKLPAIKAKEFPPPAFGEPITWVILSDTAFVTLRKGGGFYYD